MRTLRRLLTAAVLLYVSALGFLFFFQRDFLYFPTGLYRAPTTPFEEVAVVTEDGLSLKGWLCPAKEQKKTLLFFHGNADSLEKAASIGLPYCQNGFGFLAAAFRGYSGFEGKPTEQGLYADARAFTCALKERGIKEENLVFFGHSLGAGVATQMALETPKASGLILAGPFLSVPQMAQKRYPFFPVRYLVWDVFANEEKLPRLRLPILIVHGIADKVVPFTHGQTLAKAAPADTTTFLAIPGGGHSDIFQEPFTSESLAWLARLPTAPF